MDEIGLDAVAGLAAYAAIFTLLVSAVALALFFGGAGRIWGPINDVFVAFTALLLVAPMLALVQMRHSPPSWFVVVALAAVVGAGVIAAGQLLLVARVIPLQASFVTGGVGVVPVLAWLVAFTYLVLAGGIAMPTSVGWLGAGVLAASAVLAVTSRITVLTIVMSVVLVTLLSIWLYLLGQALLAAV